MNDTNPPFELAPIPGMRLATASVRGGNPGRPDLLLAAFEPGTTVAGTLTRSSTAAAPVRWTRARLAEGAAPRALVASSGNANCFTGLQGDEAVRRTAACAARLIGCRPEEVYIASTGRIGEQLPMDRFEAALAAATAALPDNRWNDAAHAIMTTDGFPKADGRRSAIGDVPVTLQGITKGATMIAPHMATTLSFLFTDAALPGPVMTPLLQRAVNRSYNRITVDNTQSTNDTILLFASGRAAHAPVTSPDDPRVAGFDTALLDLLHGLSQRILRDGAGGGTIMKITVRGSENEDAAVRMARAVADSHMVRRGLIPPAFMTLGRIIAAIGSAEEAVALDRLSLSFGDGDILCRGGVMVGVPDIDPTPYIRNGQFEIVVDVGVGVGMATIYSVVG